LVKNEFLFFLTPIGDAKAPDGTDFGNTNAADVTHATSSVPA
jgi:hypothetical protein